MPLHPSAKMLLCRIPGCAHSTYSVSTLSTISSTLILLQALIYIKMDVILPAIKLFDPFYDTMQVAWHSTALEWIQGLAS